VFLAFFAGFYAPSTYVSNIAAKRRASVVGGLPGRARSAADLRRIRACRSSGDQQGEPGGRRLPRSSWPEELSLLVAELSYLPDRRLAYEGLAKRVNHPASSRFAPP
jgi:tight adherence protein C